MRPLTTPSKPEVIRACAPRRPHGNARLRAAVFAMIALAAGAVDAEKADRTQPMRVSFDKGPESGVVDLKNHSSVLIGNVVITQGTLEIHADRVELSEDADGNQLGFAFGTPAKPATFRQKRDMADEYSEGDAQKIEYDSAANRVRFVGDAHLRLLKGTAVTDQANAALITYDTVAETVKLGSGTPGVAASSAGRPTIIFTPKASSAPVQREPLTLSNPASGPSK